MDKFVKDIQVRWSDLDPNIHLRHSVYYDFAAFSRISFLDKFSLTADAMQRLKIGPILFREECIFKREIRLGDTVTIDLQLMKARRDYSRWTIQHQLVKNGDILSAILTVEGAWLDVIKRKLAEPPKEVHDVFSQMPVSPDFTWLD